MRTDGSIFGLRFGTNIELVPAPDELNDFLENTQKNDGRGTHSIDLTRYRGLLRDFDEFGKPQKRDAAQHNFRERMLYGVLRRSRFVSSMLLSLVEQYKYHVHTLGSLDFLKPTAFIRSAEEEMGRLDPGRKTDAVKLGRLRAMVEERNATLGKLEKRWAALIAELSDITLYIRDNLTRIRKICEASIVILVELQIRKKLENELIEDIKTSVRDQIQDSLHQGSITREQLEIVKKEVVILTQEMSALFRDDIFALTRLFEAIHDHATKTILEINALMGKTNRRKGISVDEQLELFTQVEQALVSLVSGFNFDVKIPRTQTATAYKDILATARGEALDYIFELLERERRSGNDRRSNEDRRKYNDPDYDGPERRSNSDRRGVKRTRHSREFPA
jgi:hypothetical protein